MLIVLEIYILFSSMRKVPTSSLFISCPNSVHTFSEGLDFSYSYEVAVMKDTSLVPILGIPELDELSTLTLSFGKLRVTTSPSQTLADIST